jgi:uncharacterized protein YbbC (DUF1343 family)
LITGEGLIENSRQDLLTPPAEVLGRRIGLITNQSGMDRQQRSTIDLIRAMPGVTLVALFSPEHGIRGVAEARVDSSVDEDTGLPIHSLYGETNKPTPAMLRGVDVLVYDIEDLGVRQYTYESTLALAMQAAAENDIPIIVLDRPNPVTGRIMEGNILEPEFQSFVGIYPVLSRHGMTAGRAGADVQCGAEHRRAAHRRARGRGGRGTCGETRRICPGSSRPPTSRAWKRRSTIPARCSSRR